MIETERMAMLWPKSLKTRVRQIAGHGGMTEYVVEAVEARLNGADQVIDERREARELAQTLADKFIFTTASDRLQALAELDIPDWIDTSDWPAEFAKASPVEEKVMKVAADSVTVFRERERREPIETRVSEVWQKPNGPAEGRPTNLTLEEPMDPPVVSKDRDDLFARVMAKAGNADELAQNRDKFTPASEVKGAHSKRLDDEGEGKGWQELVDNTKCPKCNSELVDGECWTCG